MQRGTVLCFGKHVTMAQKTLKTERRRLPWARAETRSAHDRGSAVAVDVSGNVVVTGCSRDRSDPHYYTAKYAAADGALVWEQRYDGPANEHDVAQAVALDGSGNVVVTGFSGSSP